MRSVILSFFSLFIFSLALGQFVATVKQPDSAHKEKREWQNTIFDHSPTKIPTTNNPSTKMAVLENDKKIDWTSIITFLGVVAAWLPLMISYFARNKIKGRVLSAYHSQVAVEGQNRVVSVFKLSIISLNKHFYLSDIFIHITYDRGGLEFATAKNIRNLIFDINGVQKKFSAPESTLINNMAFLEKDRPVVGYIIFNTSLLNIEKISKVQFFFKSYNGTSKSLSIDAKQMDPTKLSYDDSIWINV